MLAPAQDFIDAIARQELKITELFDLALMDGTTRYFTSHDEDFLWGSPSVKYESLPILRGIIVSGVNLEADQVEITLANITTELMEQLQKNVLDGAQLTIRRVLYDQSYGVGMELFLFTGTVDVGFNRKVLMLMCTSILDTLNILVPRNVYQEPCNYRLFQEACAVSRSGSKLTGSASSDATDFFTLVDTVGLGAAADGYYSLGEIEITSGENKGARKFIRRQLGTVVTVASAFAHKIETGDTYDIYPGCDKRSSICDSKFSNHENFYGFSYIPKPEETMF